MAYGLLRSYNRNMVGNKKQVFDLIRQNRVKFKKFGIKRLGVFGSFARDQISINSDVDLLVEFSPGEKNYRNLYGIADLAEKLFRREVEVVTHESLSPYIAPHIEKEVEYVEISN